MTQTDIDQPLQEIPVACTLSDRDRARRQEEIADTLFNGRQGVRELPDGYALCFPGGDASATQLLAFITAERACCPFFRFELVFEQQQGPIWLHLRGPAGTKELVATMLASGEKQGATLE